MIRLNTEAGLVELDSWSNVLAIPGFVRELSADQHELKEILAVYAFDSPVPCGLSNCHQPHRRGYVVQTKNGPITNIGNICGKRYFGVLFNQLARDFRAAIRDARNRERIETFQFRIPEIQARIADLRHSDRGADWIRKCSRELITLDRGCPNCVVERMKQMVRARNSTISITRLATQAERDLQKAMDGEKRGPTYIEEPIARLRGTEALYEENDLHKLVVLDLEVRLQNLQDVKAANLTSRQLRDWSNWISRLDKLFERATDIVKAGRLLLTRDNLEPLSRLLNNSIERKKFKQFLDQLDHTPA